MPYVINPAGASVKTYVTSILISLSIIAAILLSQPQATVSPSISPDHLLIGGLVSNPLNLSYTEIANLQMVSEAASLQCVYAPQGTTYNWTGVPLFYLLNLSGVQPEAKEVVFHATDGFSSSLTLDKAMHPTTIVALKVNGEKLNETNGYPYKLVVPCRYGYKWVHFIDEIEIVDYDYKGTYESQGFPDEAVIPGCLELPQTEPAYMTLNALGDGTTNVTVFSDATIEDAIFNLTTNSVQITASSNSSSDDAIMYVAVPRQLISSNFSVISNGVQTEFNMLQSQTNTYIILALNGDAHNVVIKGAFYADVTGPNDVPDGKVNLMSTFSS